MAVAHRFFTPGTAATFRAAAACIVPPDDESPGADSDVALEIADRALANRPLRDQKLLRTFLRVVEFLPIFRRGRRFSRLSRAHREAFLRGLERSWLGKFRQGFFGLKTFVLMGYYGSEECFREIGYPGPRLDAPYYQLRQGEGDP